MGAHLDQIITAARRGLGYAEKLAADVPAADFASKPRFRDAGKEVVVDCNHPAFVYGHLCLYPARMASFTNISTAPLAAPAPWTDLFKAGAECKDDPEGRLYPKKDEILAAFPKLYHAFFDALAKADDGLFTLPHPDEGARSRGFPTVGAFIAFLSTSHVMMHAGQISTWRRCFGLPGIM